MKRVLEDRVLAKIFGAEGGGASGEEANAK
jgi:hypothetical protein